MSTSTTEAQTSERASERASERFAISSGTIPCTVEVVNQSNRESGETERETEQLDFDVDVIEACLVAEKVQAAHGFDKKNPKAWTPTVQFQRDLAKEFFENGIIPVQNSTVAWAVWTRASKEWVRLKKTLNSMLT